MFHNLRGYDGQLIILEISKFDVKTTTIPNGLRKYMAFPINKNFVFIDSMECLNLSLDTLLRICQKLILSIYLKNLVVIC